MQMAMFTKGIGLITNPLVMEFTLIKMVRDMKETGLTMYRMAMESNIGWMGLNMKEIMQKE